MAIVLNSTDLKICLKEKIGKMLKLLRQNKNWSLSSEIWNIYQNYPLSESGLSF